MTPGPSRIAIVIVTYNSADVIEGCLRSLAAGARGTRLADVVVADNASRDGTLQLAEGVTGLPVRTVQLGRNAGYAAAVNAGVGALDLGGLDAVLVINPDCRLRPGALTPLAEALRRPGCGIAVPRLVNPDGSLQPSLRRTPTVGRALAEAVIGGGLAGRIGTLGELVTDPREYERPAPAAWATGAAMLVATGLIGEIGPWDESFLLYSEETEYALRAADRGWSLWYEPASVVEHIGGDSGVNPTLAALLTVNKVRLFRRRRSGPASLAYFLAVVAGEAVRALAGRRTSRASVVALLRPSRRLRRLAD
ncbi:GT2 family glycosyltransferase [Streptosporangium becharense]|uniref:GT2 family glycosyltransferase n=1 Tax=Streptosporangium becharense TaxID=1816182 RepID=A0A7W9IGY0_9ACTN|nr:glycosyltransferase family 2 protein [Streptosporangium becharense]MBB2909117.1 GT2 family glycosyltransferase [Streptosporangium becharense]MBB5819864.1 GT2 family glycosyltransferase [Streptosporangium becharense]